MNSYIFIYIDDQNYPDLNSTDTKLPGPDRDRGIWPQLRDVPTPTQRDTDWPGTKSNKIQVKEENIQTLKGCSHTSVVSLACWLKIMF